MTDITVTKVPSPNDRKLPVFAEMDRLTQAIGRRARVFWEERGFRPGFDLDDWLKAEHEFCWPAAELSERGKELLLDVALPGYESSEVELTVTPREIILHASKKRERIEEEVRTKERTVRWSEFGANDVYRRVELPASIDVEHVKATLRHGMLHVTAPKATAVVSKIPVATAA